MLARLLPDAAAAIAAPPMMPQRCISPVLSLPSHASPLYASRRAVFGTLLPVALATLASPSSTAAVDAPALTPSAMLTAGQYLNDIKQARNGLEEVRPLISLNEERGYEATRITIRKPPVNGIRKACSKLLTLLDEKSATYKAKSQLYDAIKLDLGALDDGCRPDLKTRPDLLALVTKLQSDLDEFGSGLGVSAAD